MVPFDIIQGSTSPQAFLEFYVKYQSLLDYLIEFCPILGCLIEYETAWHPMIIVFHNT